MEALVRRRVLEGTFDDVARKTLADTSNYKPRVQLEFTKSKKVCNKPRGSNTLTLCTHGRVSGK